jgi:hypothetical protein
MPCYPNKRRTEAKKNFAVRVDLAREVTYIDHYVGDDAPLVDELDKTVLLVGHAYRNAAYHRDAHNPAMIASVGRLLFATVARLVVRCQSNSLGVDSRATRLEQFGVPLDGGMCTMRDAAAAIVTRLVDGLDTDLEALAAELAEDLEARRAEVEELVNYLGTSGHDVDELIASAEFRDKQAGDEELLRLSALMDPRRRANELGLSEIPDEFVQEAHAAPRQYREHMAELERRRPPEARVARLSELPPIEERLRRGGDVAMLLSAYYEADVILGLLERYVGDAVSAYDQYVQDEIDRARGK